MHPLNQRPDLEDHAPIEVTNKRLLLSWYLDFLFFMTVWGLLVYFLRIADGLPFWVPFMVFLALRKLTSRYIDSIGYKCLSIDGDNMSVDRDIHVKETWLSITLGVLLILDGTKKLVRWTEMYVSQPTFGFFPDDTTQIVIHVVLGCVSILAGFWFFKLDIRGLVAGIAVALFELASALFSWDMWDPVVEQMVLVRREVQGLPVREGEVEFMQAVFPEGIVVFALIIIVAMVSTYPRFKDKMLLPTKLE